MWPGPRSLELSWAVAPAGSRVQIWPQHLDLEGICLRGMFARCVKLLFSFYRSGRIETSSEDEAGSVPSDVGLARLESVCSVLSLGVGSGRPRAGLDCSHLYVLCSLFSPR